MKPSESLSTIAVVLLLWWVREATGKGAISIIIEALPSLGID